MGGGAGGALQNVGRGRRVSLRLRGRSLGHALLPPRRELGSHRGPLSPSDRWSPGRRESGNAPAACHGPTRAPLALDEQLPSRQPQRSVLGGQRPRRSPTACLECRRARGAAFCALSSPHSSSARPLTFCSAGPVPVLSPVRAQAHPLLRPWGQTVHPPGRGGKFFSALALSSAVLLAACPPWAVPSPLGPSGRVGVGTRVVQGRGEYVLSLAQ